MKSRICQLLAPVAATAVASVLVMTGASAAHAAAPGPRLGSLTLSQPTGLDSTTLDVDTSGPCDDSTPYLQVFVAGSGFPTGGQAVTGNNTTNIFQVNPATGGYDVPLEDTLRAFAAEQMPPATLNGKYTLTLICKDAFDTIESGSYDVALWFTDPTHWQDTAPSVASTTTLTVSPGTSAATAAAVTLTAAIVPATETGTVQFKDGGTALGAPVAVAAGSASLVTSTLTSGTHSLTAVFAPTGAGVVGSTSAAVAYLISVPAPVVTEPSSLVVLVGTVISCPDGRKLAVPATEVGHVIACDSGGAFLAVQRGVLFPLVAPTLSGTGKVGTRLVLSPGVWTPAATSRSLVWKRDGTALAKQPGASYLVTKADKGHRISVTVTAHRAGFLDASASTSGSKGHVLTAADSTAAVVSARAAVAGDSTPVGVPVGTGIGCLPATVTGATTLTSTWLLDGAPYLAVPAISVGDKMLGHVLTCRTTATNAGGTTVSDAVVHVTTGAPLAAYVAPHIVGVAKVGGRLSAATGKWFPVYTVVAYQWLRDGKVIKGATKATFVLPAADKHQRISVRLTASRAGWLAGSATSAAVSVG